MGTQADHAHALATRLPPSDGIFDPDTDEDLWAMLLALAAEPARVDIDLEQHLADFMPDTCGVTGAYIDDWARVLALPESWESDAWDSYTDQQKQDVIVAKLQVRSDPNLPNLQQAFRDLFNDQTITLTHHEHAAFLAGGSSAGDPCGAWGPQIWTLRYMDSALDVGPNAFDSWTYISAGSVNTGVDNAPYGGDVAGAADETNNGSFVAETEILGTVDGDEVRIAVWVSGRSGETSDSTVTVQIRKRDGTYGDSVTVNAKPGLWQKVSVSGSVGSGSVIVPRMRISHPAPYGATLAGAFAGIRKPALELRAQDLAPIVTVGEFLVKGEDQDL